MTGKLTISYSSEAERLAKLKSVVARLDPPPERISVGELARRTGRRVSTVSRALRRPSCPGFIGKQGKRRLLWIEPTTALLAWLAVNRKGERSKKPPRR